MFELLIVDGYNIIKRWKKLRSFSNKSLDFGRESLIRLLSNYQDFTGKEVKVIFDGSKGKDLYYGLTDVEVIFSGQGKSADEFIERLVYLSKEKSKICVATSDRMIRMMVEWMGAKSMSAEELEKELKMGRSDNVGDNK